MTSSSKNIKLLNALVGLCKKDKKWPSTLANYGYNVLWLEYEIRTAEGKLIKPDLILESVSEKHAFVVETKTGGVEKDGHQIENYSTLTIEDMISKFFVNKDLSAKDITYVCLSENEPTVCQSLKDSSYRHALIAVRANEIKLILNDLTHSALDEIFKNGVEIDFSEIPRGYINFNDESPLSEIAAYVIQTLISLITKNNRPFSIEEITKDSFGDLWTVYQDTKLKNQIKGKVKQILNKAADTELKGYVSKVKVTSGEEFWKIEFTNKDGSSYPAQKLAGLSTKLKSFVQRLRNEETGDVQLPLFIE